MNYSNYILRTFINLSRKKKFTNSISIIIVVILFASCKESNSSTEPITSDKFQVEIIVKNSQGNPVPNLRICGGNKLPLQTVGNERGVFWTPAVYVARLIVQDTSQTSILFQDSIYMVYAEIDIQNPGGILGYTSSTGTFISQNMKRFPSLFNLPEMKVTSAQGPDILGVFQIMDTATFVLYDTVTHKGQSFDRVVVNSSNKYEIVWQPTVTFSSSVQSFENSSNSTVDKLRLISKSTKETTWILIQNYPNPFGAMSLLYFNIQSQSVATLVVSDVLGEENNILMNHQRVAPGGYQLTYDRK